MSLSDFGTGLVRIVQETTAENIGLIMTHSSTNSYYITQLVTLFLQRIPIQQRRILEYMAPSSSLHRQESELKVEDPSSHYVVIDNIVYTGKTLASAWNALVRNGVNRNNVWYMGLIRNVDDGIFLIMLN